MDVLAVGPDADLTNATVVIGMLEGREVAPGSEELADRISDSALDAVGFKGKPGQTAQFSLEGTGAAIVVGLGGEISFESIRSASASATRAATTHRLVTFLGRVPIDDADRAVVEGALLGGYRFDRYKSVDENEDDQQVERIEVVDGDSEELSKAEIVATATNLARDWVRTPSGDQSPQSFADELGEASPDGVDLEIWDRDRIEEEKLGALLGVAAGSERDPRVVVARYRPEESETHLALVGKGVIFDSGGLSIKPAKSMERMKTDMAGAAAVMAATFAIARLGLPVSITAVAPLTDNTIDGNATRPGDVLVPVEGPTIEVINTDAEGRLILADAMAIARRHEPDLIVDIATLTGGVVVALGNQIGAVFSPSADMASQVLDAASMAGEQMWELPLFQPYMKMLDSEIADLRNSAGTPRASAITGALFLSRFVGDAEWAHLDIAGPAESPETNAEQIKGPSGFGVRTLVELARSMSATS